MATQNPVSVTFKVTKDWGSGFTADMVIRNTGTTAINGWTLDFKAPYTIDQNWSSTLTKLPSGNYSVKPLSWNSSIAPGAAVTIGFRGLKAGGTPPAPSEYRFNGTLLGSAPAPAPTQTVLPELSISDAAIAEGAIGANGAPAALFTVSLSKASTSQVTVNYASQNGSAIAGQDFQSLQGKLTFAPGETKKTIAVPITNDTAVEATENFKLVLSGPSQAKLLDAEGIGTITDNDKAPTPTPNPSPNPTPPATSVSFQVTKDWGNGFTADLIIRNTGTTAINGWTLGFKVPYDISQSWSTGLTKLANGNYSAKPVSWNQVIPAGGSVSFGFVGAKTTGTSAIPPSGYTLNGVPLGGSTPAPGPVPPSPTTALPDLIIGDATISEGNAQALFTVSLSKASTSQVTVDYASQNDSAIAAQDFQSVQGKLTFAPGETKKTIAVNILNDTVVEPTEKFKLVLSNPTQAKLVDGEGVGTLTDNDTATPPPPSGSGQFNYGEALQKSFLFYEAQRSGDLPADNRIEWRGDSALRDGSDVGRDLSGGYYDAGDLVKFGLPLAGSLTLLGWGVQEYEGAYRRIGQLDDALDAIRWGTDYLMKCNVTDANGTKEFWAQVGDGDIDHNLWGPPETMTMARPSYKVDRQKPGSDVAGESAAALASASIIFRGTDTAYADKLLTNAMQLYTFADTYRGKYSDAIDDANTYYRSYSYQDELSWGAIWIHEALEAAGKSDTTYLAKAEANYQGVHTSGTHSWDNKAPGAAIMLAQETGKSVYRNDVERWLNYWQPGGGMTYTPGGLAWSGQWGSLRYAANTAFLAGIYSDTVNDPQGKYSAFAENQIDYLLGDNPRNSSYMVGFGKNSPVNPQHKGSSGKDGWLEFRNGQPNAHPLYGGLVGGPTAADDFAYKDDGTDFIANEVALDYNAGLTGALARMVDNFGGTPLSDAQLNALPGIVITGLG